MIDRTLRFVETTFCFDIGGEFVLSDDGVIFFKFKGSFSSAFFRGGDI